MKKIISDWASWFAWYPISIGGGVVFWQNVERRRIYEVEREMLGYGRSERSYWEYRFCGDNN